MLLVRSFALTFLCSLAALACGDAPVPPGGTPPPLALTVDTAPMAATQSGMQEPTVLHLMLFGDRDCIPRPPAMSDILSVDQPSFGVAGGLTRIHERGGATTMYLQASQGAWCVAAVRIFHLLGVQSPNRAHKPMEARRWSAPSTLIAYARRAARHHVSGLNGPTVDLPEGYSLLRRRCENGRTEFEVLPINALISLSPQTREHTRRGNDPFDAEDLESEWLASCGGTPRPLDLGHRITFERSIELAWSADGSTLYHLAGLQPATFFETRTSLRAIQPADGRQHELVTGLFTRLQTAANGTLFVKAWNEGEPHLVRVDVANDGLAQLTRIVADPEATVSPDGRFAAWTKYAEQTTIERRDLETGQAWSYPSMRFAGWTPSSDGFISASQLAAGGWIVRHDGTQTPTVAPTIGWLGAHPVGADGADFITSTFPGADHVLTPWNRDCLQCVGLDLVDGLTGENRRTVLAPSAGRTEVATQTADGSTVFVWAKTCQGVSETHCRAELHRIPLAGGEMQVVAVAADFLPAAVTPDGRKLALAAPNGIYLKDL
jgi:hypothetical protein